MDPIAVLQSRIEQLEAKLGCIQGPPSVKHDGNGPSNSAPEQAHQGDSANTTNVVSNLLHAAETMHNAVAGHEKLNQAMNMATELNNYTDPNCMHNMQKNQVHMQEVAAAEPVVRQYCECMHHCQEVPVLDSEPIQQVPKMQAQVDTIRHSAAEVKAQADHVFQGVQNLAQTCGAAAQQASEQIAEIAQQVEKAEEKKFPKRRNGLD